MTRDEREQSATILRAQQIGAIRGNNEHVADGVVETTLDGRHADLVADGHFVELRERRAIGGSVTGDCAVSLFAGERRALDVSGAVTQSGYRSAVHHDVRDARRRNFKKCECRIRSLRRVDSFRGRFGTRRWGGGRRRRRDQFAELVAKSTLGPLLFETRSPQLVDDEAEQQETRGDEGTTDDSEHGVESLAAPYVHWRER